MKQSNINQIEITWQQLFGDIPGIRNYCQNRICIKREVIPIIFVPGLMGSRLVRKKKEERIPETDNLKPGNKEEIGISLVKQKNSGAKEDDGNDPRIWDPDDPGFMFAKFGTFKSTAAKHKALVIGDKFDSNYAEVFNNDSAHNDKCFFLNPTKLALLAAGVG